MREAGTKSGRERGGRGRAQSAESDVAAGALEQVEQGADRTGMRSESWSAGHKRSAPSRDVFL